VGPLAHATTDALDCCVMADPQRGEVEVNPRVLDAAVKLFARRGFSATGIRDIAREAGLSSSTLYWHMSTKESLLLAVMQTGFDGLIRLGRDVVSAEQGADRQLAALVRAHVLWLTEHPDLGNVVDSELRFLSEDARAAIMPLRDEYGALWQEAVDRGVAEDIFHVSDPHLARLGIIEMCNGVSRWYRPDGHQSAEAIAEAFVELVFNSLRASAPATAA
jgi:AcrR family transcriptional regulator